MEFPTIDKFAKDVAEKALDEYVYDGKTIREWVEIIAKQQPCEDCISREAVLDIIEKEEFKGDAIYEIEKKLPSVQPTRPTGKWIDIGDEGIIFKCSLCGLRTTIESHYCPNCGARMAESEGKE